MENINDSRLLVSIYDQHAPEMENVTSFYEWVLNVFGQYDVPVGATILDVGCGTGALLAALYQSGYHHLDGIDFSQGCLSLATSKRIPAQLSCHDIVMSTYPKLYDIVFMTTVIDFVADPVAVLRHTRQSLIPDGLLFISIRNLGAYYPWYHLEPLAKKLSRWPRARHWFHQFTTPLSLRRDEYPVDNMFKPSQMRRMLASSGFAVIDEHASMILPMFWIWDMPRLVGMMNKADSLIRFPREMGYRYMFVCRRN